MLVCVLSHFKIKMLIKAVRANQVKSKEKENEIFFILNKSENLEKISTFLKYIFQCYPFPGYCYILHLGFGLQKGDTSQVVLLYPQGRIT